MRSIAWPLCGLLVMTPLAAPGARAQSEGEGSPWPADPLAEADPATRVQDLVFADDFEITSPCHWSATSGWTGTCPGTCGDFVTGENEACDDGNQITETQCPYGTIFCTRCNSTCSAVLPLSGQFCGDGDLSMPNGEECDDGNMVTENECPYGAGSCMICDAACGEVPQTGGVCGDGTTDFPYEDCDDRNTSSCGTCTADCRNTVGPAQASGMLIVPAGSALADGETFTLDNGLGVLTNFEFDTLFNGVSPGNVQVIVAPAFNESQVRNACLNAINAAGVGFSVASGGFQIVQLVNNRATSAGNVAIGENVASALFTAIGMSGGEAGNCPNGVGCQSGADCLSANCVSGFCQ